VAVERKDGVSVVVPPEFGFPSMLSAPIKVITPTLGHVDVGPGDSDYFDQCMLGVSHTFALGMEGTYGRER
jgi:hypothetical protein